jgi:hypothetical protein
VSKGPKSGKLKTRKGRTSLKTRKGRTSFKTRKGVVPIFSFFLFGPDNFKFPGKTTARESFFLPSVGNLPDKLGYFNYGQEKLLN